METITLTVNTTVDENDGGNGGEGLSLRDALSIANQSPENNYIIELQGGSTYNLTVDSGDPGDNHLDIGQGNVTIRATGNQRATIDASGLANPDVVLHFSGDANVNLENLTITGGIAEGNDEIPGLQFGGGLVIADNSTVTITNSLITGNSASAGGGIYAGENTSVTLIDSEVSDNQSNLNGGGIASLSNNLTIRNSTINNNTVVEESDENTGGLRAGGGLYIADNSIVTITNSLITNNSAGRTGGGIFAKENTSVTLVDSEVSNNQSNFNGGGILSVSDNFTIRSSRIIGNTVTDEDRGGGIIVRDGTTNILDTTIDGNSSVFGRGGGIAVINAEVNIYSSTITNNTSGSSGAGINVDTSRGIPIVTISNSTISGNVAGFVGGGVYLEYPSLVNSSNDPVVVITNSTISNNTANANLDNITGGAGGGIATGENNRIAVSNSIVTGNIDGRDNTPSDVSGFFYTDLAFGASERGILGDGNNIIGTLDRVSGTIGTGSDLLGVDPLLTPLEDNGNGRLTYGLQENSPAIDGGNNGFVPTDFFDIDRDGNVDERVPLDSTGSDRIVNQIVDIGAFEFGSTVNTPNNPPDNSSTNNTVFRFFNNDAGVHFYTASEIERDSVLELDNFSFEGGSYTAADPLTGMPSPQPVYRFLNQDTGVHLYTISEVERDVTQELDNFSFEGEAFFAYETAIEGTIPIYRFFNPTTGAHFYTPSEAERDNVAANLANFQSEGIAYFAFPVI